MVVTVLDPFPDFFQANSAHFTDRVGEVVVHDVLLDSNNFENLGRLVRLERGNTHLGGDFYDSVEDRLVIVVNGSMRVLVQKAVPHALFNALLCKIRVDGTGAVAEERSKLVDRARLRRLQNDGDCRPLLRPDQVMLNGGNSEKGRNCDVVLVHSAVGEDDDIRPVPVGLVHFDVQVVDCLFERGGLVVQQGDGLHPEPLAVHVLDFQDVDTGEDRVLDFQNVTVFGSFPEQVSIRSDIDMGIRDDLLPERVDRRVGDLGKLLFEVIEEKLVLVGEDRKRDIHPHGSDGLTGIHRHWKDRVEHVLIRIAECLVQPVSLFLGIGLDFLVRNGEIRKLLEMHVEPLPVGRLSGIVLLELLIRDKTTFLRIDQEHFARLQAGFFHDFRLVEVEDADLRRENEHIILRDVIARRAKAIAV